MRAAIGESPPYEKGQALRPARPFSKIDHRCSNDDDLINNDSVVRSPYASVHVLWLEFPMPTVEASTYADGYRAGRRSLEPFLDYSKFTGRIDDLPIAKGA